MWYNVIKVGDSMNDDIKGKPKFKYYTICGLIVTFIPIVIPNLDFKTKLYFSIPWPILCFICYYIKLELYARWSDSYINKRNKEFDNLNKKHDLVKKEHKKVSRLLEKHQHFSSRFIDHLLTQSSINQNH